MTVAVMTAVASYLRSSRLRRVGKEAVLIAAGQAAAALGALMSVRFMTGVLSPAQYGELALGVTLGGLLMQVSLVPIYHAALRFFGPAHEANELRACLRVTSRVAARAAWLVVGLWLIVAEGLVLSRHQEWIGLATGALALALLSGYERVLDALQSSGRQRAITAWHQGLGQWLRFPIAVSLIAWFGARSSIAMLGYVLATALVLASQFRFFWSRWWPLVSAEPDSVGAADRWSARMREYSRPFALWGAFLWVQQSSDRWALGTFGTASDVGHYSVLYQLGYWPIILLTSVLGQLVAPILFNQAGEGTDRHRVRQVRLSSYALLGTITVVALIAAGVAQWLHLRLFAMFVAPEYRDVSWLLPPMLLSGGLFACGEMAALMMMTGLHTRKLTSVKIGTSLVGVGLNAGGAYWFGVRGVVFSSLMFSSLYLVWTLERFRSAA